MKAEVRDLGLKKVGDHCHRAKQLVAKRKSMEKGIILRLSSSQLYSETKILITISIDYMGMKLIVADCSLRRSSHCGSFHGLAQTCLLL